MAGSEHTEGEPASDLTFLLRWLIRQSPGSVLGGHACIEAWWPVFRDARRQWAVPFDQAVVGGVLADRVGYAFASGYQSALRRLVPALPGDRIASFSVTEDGGAHPRAIKTTLQPGPPAGDPPRPSWRLCGHKKWATLACPEGIAIVVASTGTQPEGRNQLRAARVALGADGITLTRMPPTPFAPEVFHCQLHFDDVALTSENILPGDGYTEYVRRFRTIEDTHVTGAVLGHLWAVAVRFDWPSPAREELLNLITSLRAIGTSDPDAPEMHVVLGGFLAGYPCWLERLAPHWERVAPEVRARWERDVGLLGVARNARAKRLDSAWRQLGGVSATTTPT